MGWGGTREGVGGVGWCKGGGGWGGLVQGKGRGRGLGDWGLLQGAATRELKVWVGSGLV